MVISLGPKVGHGWWGKMWANFRITTAPWVIPAPGESLGRGIFFGIFFSWLLSWLLVAPGGSGGSWSLLWLLWLLAAGFCGFYGFYGCWLLWLIYHLSINQSISEACSSGACCALDTHPSISISISISFYLHLYLSIYHYLSIYLPTYLSIYLKGLHYHRDDVQSPSQPWTKPKYTDHQPYIYKEILNQHDDNIQWIYCASLCLNLHSRCFQGACRVVYTPWVSHSTQHLAYENRCFQSAMGGGAALSPQSAPSFFLNYFKFKLAHFSVH